jgi:hypothetical protein
VTADLRQALRDLLEATRQGAEDLEHCFQVFKEANVVSNQQGVPHGGVGKLREAIAKAEQAKRFPTGRQSVRGALFAGETP